MKKLLTLIYLIAISTLLFSQSVIPFKLSEYGKHLPLEKVYAQTNKILFTPNETIYFTAYITNEELLISNKSRMLKAEFVNPAGQVIETKFFAKDNITAKGSFKIKPDAVGGQYKLRLSTAWSPNLADQIYEKEITVLRSIAPRILMKLDIEKEAYGKNDTVNAFLHIRDLNNVDISHLSFDYEVNIDGVYYFKKEAKTDKNGKDTITFVLPAHIKDQHTSLNVIFNYNLYQESITRNVPIITDDIDLQFLPEGGFMLAGLANNMAFKAVNKEGNPADIKGNIYDDKGNFVTGFASFHQGMGKLVLTPFSGYKYYAQITSPYQSAQKIELPQSKSTGFPINIVEIDKGQVVFNILSNQNAAITLFVRSEQKLYDTKNIDLKAGMNRQIIDTKDFPVGVLSLCVAQGNNIISERLFFNKIDENLNIKITPDKQSYQSRETTKLNIKTASKDGHPIPAILSLSVIDDKYLSYLDDKQHNMLSWMLFGSSIKSAIYEPSFYFDPTEAKRIKAIDMVLLTQGWRNYKWDAILGNDKLLIKSIDTQNIIAGKIKQRSSDDDKPYPTTVYIVADSLLYIVDTDQKGYFQVETPPTKYWQVFVKKHRMNDNIDISQITLAQESPVRAIEREITSISDFNLSTNPTSETSVESNVENTAGYTNNKIMLRSSDDQQLDEVIITGYSTINKKSITAASVVVTSKDLISIPNSNIISALSGSAAGLYVTTSAEKSNFPMSIRGIASIQSTNGPLIIVDGVILNNASSINLSNLDLSSINSVNVLRNAEATAIYGTRAANGVILIRTSNTSAIEDNQIWTYFNHNRIVGSYQLLQTLTFNNSALSQLAKADEYYYPKYETRKVAIKNDFRDNVYWNYHIETDKEGNAMVSFPNGDENSLFRVIAEGITGNGQVGRDESPTYSVKDDLSIDIKLPLYASQDDIIQAPLWITNNSDKDIEGKIKINVPRGLHLDNKDSVITISKNERTLKLIPLEVTTSFPKEEKIRFSLETEDDKLGIIKDIQLFDKGFPIEFGKSTTNHLNHSFEVNNPIGLQHLKVDLYLSPIQQITDGLQRIVREPYGCFEQVSSAVYPNIYALQLLKQSGDNNALEQKTLEYLKNGYGKLAAYEIKGGGFDWYGRPPAHEVLSAFGLLEFIAMKPYIDVNTAMIDRTKEWLLSKKNGKGGYHQGEGKYAFSGNRKTINNTYITYALSVAGCTSEIEKEYSTAKEEAIRSKDLYRLSLVALTAKELKKESDYKMIVSILHTMLPMILDSKNNKVEHIEGSITSSYGGSLRNETLALMALVFAREGQLNPPLIQTINELIENSKSGYFGSTQATGLSLNAISSYYQLISNSSKNKVKISFQLDGKELLTEEFNEKSPLSWNFYPRLEPGKHHMEMSIEGVDFGVLSFNYNYKTSLPPNSAERSLDMHTSLSNEKVKVGDNSLLKVNIKNIKKEPLPMSIAKIGLPGGLSPEPKQLRELLESGQVDFYEIFNNYLVLYWREIGPTEEKNISIDLKAQVPGNYTGAASSTYMYYTEEFKHWNKGLNVQISQ